MVRKLIVFVVVAVITYLVCIFVSGVLATTNAPIAEYVGSFLKEFASLIAVLAGLYYAFIGGPGLPVV